MFDYVTYKTPCPKCGSEINEWQSKDREWPGMVRLLPADVDYFHTSCDRCGVWLEARMVEFKRLDVPVITIKEPFKPMQ